MPARKTRSTSRKPRTSMQKSMKTNPLNPYAREFLHLQNEIKKAYKQLEKGFSKHESLAKLQKANNQLLLLLGECNYIARECYRFTTQEKNM